MTRAPLGVPADLDLSKMNDAIIRIDAPQCIGTCRKTTPEHEKCWKGWQGDEILRTELSSTKCRPGCPTQDHVSYAACCRGIQFDAKGTARTFGQQTTDRELAAYRQARSEGIQPRGTKMAQVEAAMRISDASGVAYGV